MYFIQRNPLGTTIEPAELSYVPPQLVATTTLTAAATSIDFTGLDINSDGGLYEIIIRAVAGTANVSNGYIFINGDTTANHYDKEYLTSTGGVVGGGHSDTSEFCAMSASQEGFFRILVGITNGYVYYYSDATYTRTPQLWFHNGIKTDSSEANVTQITLTNSQANGWGIGTTVEIWKYPRA